MTNISDKKMEIIHSCMRVFAKKGYHKSTIDDIASQAGVAKGTVYLYFSGKDQLFEEMLNFILCKYYNKIKIILSCDESIKNRIKKLTKYYRDNISEHMNLIQTLISEYNPMSSDKVSIIFKRKRDELSDLLFEFMDDGILRGEIREDIDRYIASLSIFSTIEHYYLDKTYGQCLKIDEIEDDPLIDFILKILK